MIALSRVTEQAILGRVIRRGFVSFSRSGDPGWALGDRLWVTHSSLGEFEATIVCIDSDEHSVTYHASSD